VTALTSTRSVVVVAERRQGWGWQQQWLNVGTTT